MRGKMDTRRQTKGQANSLVDEGEDGHQEVDKWIKA